MRKIALYFVLFVASGWSADAAEIALRSEAVCTGSVVRLADVAEIAAADASLARLALFPAPAAGKPRTVRRREIEELLQLSGVTLRECRVSGAESVTIRSGSETAEKVLRRPAYQVVPASLNVIPVERANTAAAVVPTPAPPAAAPKEKLVARGQSITIRAVAPGVRVTSPGKSLAEGTLGDLVLVELAESRQQLQARVAGPQLVEIQTAAGQPAGK